jgi:mannose-1-phosphate guanylyltransferase / phosphomannomutase
VWTKLSASHLMEVARSQHVTLAASQSGGFIFPSFLPAYDGAATLVNLVALLTTADLKLSELVAELPPVHVVHQAVHTPWDQKGMVMRTLVERSQGRELVLVDGVKVIEDDGWALVLPDPEEPLTHVWAEAGTDSGAEARAKEYVVRLEQLLR